MQTNTSKFQSIIISNIPVDTRDIMLQIDDDIVLKPDTQIKVLGVTLDNKLNFIQHVSVTRTKWVKHLNVLAIVLRLLSHPRLKISDVFFQGQTLYWTLCVFSSLAAVARRNDFCFLHQNVWARP